jgi:hypothetical protein
MDELDREIDGEEYSIFLKARHRVGRSMKMCDPSAVTISWVKFRSRLRLGVGITTNSRSGSDSFIQKQPRPERKPSQPIELPEQASPSEMNI